MDNTLLSVVNLRLSTQTYLQYHLHLSERMDYSEITENFEILYENTKYTKTIYCYSSRILGNFPISVDEDHSKKTPKDIFKLICNDYCKILP